jgi:hypothetical protein
VYGFKEKIRQFGQRRKEWSKSNYARGFEHIVVECMAMLLGQLYAKALSAVRFAKVWDGVEGHQDLNHVASRSNTAKYCQPLVHLVINSILPATSLIF